MIEFKCITEKVERLVVEALAHEDGGAFVKAIGSMLGGSNYSIDYEGLTKELESVVESALMQIDRSHVVDGAGNLLGTEYSSTMEEVERLIEVNKGRVELTRSLEPHAIEEQYVGFVARSKLERIDFLHGVGRERAIGEQLLLVRPEDLLQEPEVLEVRIERHDRLPESMSIEHEPQAQCLAVVGVNRDGPVRNARWSLLSWRVLDKHQDRRNDRDVFVGPCTRSIDLPLLMTCCIVEVPINLCVREDRCGVRTFEPISQRTRETRSAPGRMRAWSCWKRWSSADAVTLCHPTNNLDGTARFADAWAELEDDDDGTC